MTKTIPDNDVVLERAVSKAARKIVPFLALMFVIAFLDRTNIGFAKAELQADTGLSNAAYAFGAGIFFFGYALFEVPSNMVLYRVGARRWLARIMITWGLVAAAMVFAHTERLFYLIRFLLGVAEAGFYPGAILYMTFWFPTKMRARMNAFFQFGAPLAFVIGGPISGWLISISDGWFWSTSRGWQNMFLIEGLVACLVGVIAMFHLPDGPRTSKWLNDEEKDVLATAIGAEESEKKEHAQRGMFKALVDWRVIYFCVVCFTIQVLGYGYNFYIPTQVSALLGRSVGLAVGLVTAIPAVFAVIGLALVPRWAERIDRRRQVAVAVYAMGAIGIALSGVLSGNPLLTIAALCLAYTGHIVVQPLFWTNVSTYLTSGAAASGIALIGALGNLGGFVGPNIRVWAEGAFHSGNAGLYTLAVFAGVGTLGLWATRLFGMDRDRRSSRPRRRRAGPGDGPRAGPLRSCPGPWSRRLGLIETRDGPGTRQGRSPTAHDPSGPVLRGRPRSASGARTAVPAGKGAVLVPAAARVDGGRNLRHGPRHGTRPHRRHRCPERVGAEAGAASGAPGLGGRRLHRLRRRPHERGHAGHRVRRGARGMGAHRADPGRGGLSVLVRVRQPPRGAAPR